MEEDEEGDFELLLLLMLLIFILGVFGLVVEIVFLGVAGTLVA